jgi:orotidine-5'-phosphate decarboxylase
MNRDTLINQIRQKQSFLCVGLDSDIEKIPAHLNGDVLAFNKSIIEATKDYCVSYKVNTAFYESQGAKGWHNLIETFKMIPETHFIIADAKRGDIGNTSNQYAKAFFEKMNCDAVTVAPYMGKDSLQSFLDYENKWTIVLGLTSNQGAEDFELLDLDNGKKLYEEVIGKISNWGNSENLMFVTGATQASHLGDLRKIIPNHFLLIPGVGKQGGDLKAISKVAMNDDIGILVNSSRSIIFASNGEDFAEAAATEAKKVAGEMKEIMSSRNS